MFHGCRDLQITGCQIMDALHAGIEIKDCERGMVTGNSIVDRRDPVQMVNAIRLAGTNRDIMIQHNLLRGTSGPNIVGARAGAFVRN